MFICFLKKCPLSNTFLKTVKTVSVSLRIWPMSAHSLPLHSLGAPSCSVASSLPINHSPVISLRQCRNSQLQPSPFSFPYVAFPSFSPLPCLRERSICFPISPPPPLILMLSPLSLRPAPSSVSLLLLQVFLFVNNFPISFQTSSQLIFPQSNIIYFVFKKLTFSFKLSSLHACWLFVIP